MKEFNRLSLRYLPAFRFYISSFFLHQGSNGPKAIQLIPNGLEFSQSASRVSDFKHSIILIGEKKKERRNPKRLQMIKEKEQKYFFPSSCFKIYVCTLK